MSERSIAIIGFGPRGVGALERLLAHHACPGSEQIDVTIFEPHPTPGAGSGYDPNQAPYLLMNFPAAKIDLGWKSAGPPSPVDIPSFIDWAPAGSEPAESWYPPRALVGRYISMVAAKLLETASFPVQFHPSPVLDLESTPSGWLVRTSPGSHRFDEVLLAVGHAPSGSLTRSVPDLPGKGQADIRGFGLTAIDLILDLTEGRGGRFHPVGPGALEYSGTQEGPSVIFPHSRHGRPMLVKPELSSSPVPSETAIALIEESRRSLIELPAGSGIEQLGTTLASLAGGLLGSNDKLAAGWIVAATNGKLMAASDPAESINRSLKIAHREIAPDIHWALGLAWRSIYPAMVERFSHGGMPRSEARRYWLFAAELERLAFGPPPVNGAKLLALVDAGVLDLTELEGPPGSRSRIQIDSVTEPPGLSPRQQPMSRLVEDGAVRVPEGLRGIEVTRSARCVGSNGEATEGLAACGRLTEDWVIGNDTLDRSLHPEIDRWAAEVCGFDRAEAAEAVAA